MRVMCDVALVLERRHLGRHLRAAHGAEAPCDPLRPVRLEPGPSPLRGDVVLAEDAQRRQRGGCREDLAACRAGEAVGKAPAHFVARAVDEPHDIALAHARVLLGVGRDRGAPGGHAVCSSSSIAPTLAAAAR